MPSQLSDNTMALAIKYAPEYTPDPKAYVELVLRQVLGTNRDGELRPAEDLIYFMQVAKNAGLDPTLKQIYPVYRWNSSQGKEVMSIQVGIDGLRIIADKTGLYGGNDEPVFEEKDGAPLKATVTVYKINAKTGERMPFTASARWSEYVQTDKTGKPTSFWANKPYLMLGKVAEATALRKAFPNTAQLYIPEEMPEAKTELPTPAKFDKEAPKLPNTINTVEEAESVVARLKQNKDASEANN